MLNENELLISCCGMDDPNIIKGIFIYNKITHEIEHKLDINIRGIQFHKDILYCSNSKEGIIALNKKRDIIYEFRKKGDWHGLIIVMDQVIAIDSNTDTFYLFDLQLNFIRTIKYIYLRNVISRHHINDFIYSNNCFYFTCFFHDGDISKETDKQGSIIYMGTDSAKIYKLGLTEPHSLIQYKNEIWYCESKTGKIYVNSECTYEVKTKSYIRGLYINEEYIYVGLSKNKHNETDTQCGIMKINKITGEEHFTELPAFQIYNIIG